MYQIDMEKFGAFLGALRRERNMTQKELGERLFVSDKTVSKWERGQSIPNVSLLIPLSEILGITVTELLKGERICENVLNLEEIEELVAGAALLSAQEQKSIDSKKKKWKILFFICFGITMAELSLISIMIGPAVFEDTSLLLMTALSFAFALWFCFCSKDVLQTYYDENRINFISDGIFRMNLPGVSFNNRNWPHIQNASRIYLLGLGIIFPLLYSLSWIKAGTAIASVIDFITLSLLLGIFVIIYLVAKKYEYFRKGKHIPH